VKGRRENSFLFCQKQEFVKVVDIFSPGKKMVIGKRFEFLRLERKIAF
jgi:hypothetical protein